MKSKPTWPKTRIMGTANMAIPIISDRRIWIMAAHYIERHDTMAAIEAAKVADDHLAKGDLENQKIWRNIVSAIAQLTDPACERPN